jgi:hypothetical protein
MPSSQPCLFHFHSPQRYVDVREYFESLVAERASGRGNWSTLTQTRDGKLRVYLRWPDADTTGTCRCRYKGWGNANT